MIKLLTWLFLLSLVPPAVADLTPTSIVERAESNLWGKTLQGDVQMVVTTSTWERKLSLKIWMDRPTRSFIRITEPAKEAGISSLRVGKEMWNYIPAIERVIKIPPSMMLQPWFGSDFTNDDLVKESSLVQDYTHKLLPGDTQTWVVEASPKPDAAVVWGKVIYSIRKDKLIPVRQEFYDERGQLIRTLNYSDIRQMGGRETPTRWEMQPVNEPGKKTTILIQNVKYDQPISDDIFTQRQLTSEKMSHGRK